jgi:tetratricopeptide (TPR) repeat protein
METLLTLVLLLQESGPSDPGRFLEGVRAALARQDFPLAERLAQERLDSDPTDSLAWFYVGYARAAQGKFAAAVQPYQQAVRRGLGDFKAHYQLGYSAHRAGFHSIAEVSLGEAVKLKPDSGDALYYLGVSQLELSKAADAEATLTRALERSPRWSDLARFHRALARLRLSRRPEAEADLRQVAQEGQNEDLRLRARELLERPERAPAPSEAGAGARGKPWTVAWLEKGGYDSNVLQLPETSVSRSTEEGDFFLMSFAMGSLELTRDPLLTARLSLLDVSYADLNEYALDAALGSLESETPLGRAWSLLASAHGELFYLDRESLFRRAGLRGGLRYAASESVRVTAGLVALFKDFRPEAFEDLDAGERGGYAELAVKGLVPRVDVTFRYELHQEDADAADRSYLEHKVWGKGELQVTEELRARLEGGVRFRDYDAADRFYAVRREDVRPGLRATVLYAVSLRVQIFVEGEVERNYSNIGDFDYNREVGALGVLLVF